MSITLRQHSSGRLVVAAAFGLSIAATALAIPPQFEAVAVDGPPPYIHTWILDLNNVGQTVGYASAVAPALYPSRAFLWSASDAPAPAIDLGDFGGGWLFATAEAVNDSGTVVGWAEIGPGAFRGFVWNSPGPIVQLTGFTRAIDIDSEGRVLGITLSGGGAIWHDGTYTNFPALPGGHVFIPAAMNDHGQVVGRGISTADGLDHAFVYDPKAEPVYVDLGIAPGDDWDSEAVGINHVGQIVGMSRRLGIQAITSRMVIWEFADGVGEGAGWTMAHVVDPLPNDYVFIATDINDSGDVVGMSGWPQTPVLWSDGELHDLNALMAPGQNAVFFIATAINDQGWIAVDGQFGCCGYILKPVDDRTCVAADLNCDGVVDGADLGILLNAWGPCPGCAEDLNGDGVVDGADLGLLLNAWGERP